MDSADSPLVRQLLMIKSPDSQHGSQAFLIHEQTSICGTSAQDRVCDTMTTMCTLTLWAIPAYSSQYSCFRFIWKKQAKMNAKATLLQKVIKFITARKRSLGQGNIFAPVCHSVHGGSTWHPPGPGTPPGTRYTPLTRYTPQDQVPPRPGTTPPGAEHAGRYGQRADGTHPTGMQSCCNIFFKQNRIFFRVLSMNTAEICSHSLETISHLVPLGVNELFCT